MTGIRRTLPCRALAWLAAGTVVLGSSGLAAGDDGEAPAVAPAVPATNEESASGPGHAGVNRRIYLQAHPIFATLSDDGFRFGESFRDAGFTTTINLWAVYQANVTGGLATDQDWTGTYYVDSHVDLGRLAGLDGASAFARVEGGWGNGINDSVGAIMGVNGLDEGGNAIGLTHLWFQQDFLDERLRLRVGKLDSSVDAFDFHGRSVAFDAMPYANFEGTMFLDEGLVNNQAIPFPDSALGFQLFVEPVERLYVAASLTQANGNKFGISFSDLGWTFLIESGLALDLGETGLPGQYFVGYYHADFEDAPTGQGVYVGAAQLLVREAGTEDEGLGAFARYGYADRVPSGVRHFWSLGAQYKGLIPGRGDDVLGVGWAQAFTGGEGFSAPYEGLLEAYYRARLTPWLHLSGHVQYVVNPGSNDIDDAVTLGARVQVTF